MLVTIYYIKRDNEKFDSLTILEHSAINNLSKEKPTY